MKDKKINLDELTEEEMEQLFRQCIRRLPESEQKRLLDQLDGALMILKSISEMLAPVTK